MRNETVARLLARCPVHDLETAGHRSRIMDKRGEGVPIILERSLELSGMEPRYRLIDDAELLLTVWAAGPRDDET